jgi:ectoine hydroxylase-related dioxygenase (phytanoyl-CoA dioxygenase family)
MELLNITDKKNLGIVSPAFRFDIPGDTKNIRTWHQDSNYFLENEKGAEHLVAWIPINKATKDNGSVIVAPKTHTSGRLVRTHEVAEGFKSEQYTTDEKYYQNIHKEYIEAEPGDIAFINMDLIHSSGTNITNDSVRYTAQIRFNTINRDSYRPVFLKPEYPTYNRSINKQ